MEKLKKKKNIYYFIYFLKWYIQKKLKINKIEQIKRTGMGTKTILINALSMAGCAGLELGPRIN